MAWLGAQKEVQEELAIHVELVDVPVVEGRYCMFHLVACLPVRSYTEHHLQGHQQLRSSL